MSVLTHCNRERSSIQDLWYHFYHQPTTFTLALDHDQHVFFFSRTCAVRRRAPSPRPRRSSARPRHQDCGTAPCLSCCIRNDQALNHANPLRYPRARPAARRPPSQRSSPYAARAEYCRSEAPKSRMMALATTAWTTRMVLIMPARWSRSHAPPSTCIHPELSEASKAAPTGENR